MLFYFQVPMISEGVQTNGISTQSPLQVRSSSSEQLDEKSLPILPPSPQNQIPPHIASQLPGYKLQVYHLDQQQLQQQTRGPGDPNLVGLPSDKVKVPTKSNVHPERVHKHHHHHHYKHHHHHSKKGSSSMQKSNEPRGKDQSVIKEAKMDGFQYLGENDLPELIPITTTSSSSLSSESRTQPVVPAPQRHSLQGTYRQFIVQTYVCHL